MDKEDLLFCINRGIESLDIQRKTSDNPYDVYHNGVLEGAKKALEELRDQITDFEKL